MRLPALLVLTDRTQCSAPLVDVVAIAVRSGARAVVLREKDLPEPDRAALAGELAAVLEPVDGVLIHAGATDPPDPPGPVGPAGPGHDAVHLAAADPFPTRRPALVGRSCHDRGEVARAGREGCDYVTVSPVFATPSKPGYGPPLGVDGLAALALVGPPAYALGGVRPADVPACLRAGAYGVAVMGPVMRDPYATAAYLTALREVAS